MSLVDRIGPAAQALKVFPLPSVVLFPGSGLPLHIFEERYREMVRDAMAADRVIALVQPEPEADLHDPHPPIRPLCCVGTIARHQQLPDGRSNIVVQGVVRARLLDELPATHLYREFRAQLLPDADGAQDWGASEEMVRQAVLEVAARLPPDVGQGLVQVAARAKGGALADAVASAVVPDLDRRFALLAELDVGVRYRSLLSDIGEVIARLTPVDPQGPVN
jgi:Lon protease-like protein